MFFMRAAPVLALLVVVGASCVRAPEDQDDPPVTPSPTPSPVLTPTPSPVVTPSPIPVGGGTGDEPSAPDDEGSGGRLQAADVLSEGINTARDTGAGEGPSVVVTDVRLASHDGFDRVVFEIGGDGTAGWTVEYVSQPRAQGSGFPVEVEGDAYLSVRLTPVAYPADAPPGLEPWEGPASIPMPGDGPVVEVVDDTVYEGYRTFFIGVTAELPFQVRRFDSPQRVVVDVAAPGVAD